MSQSNPLKLCIIKAPHTLIIMHLLIIAMLSTRRSNGSRHSMISNGLQRHCISYLSRLGSHWVSFTASKNECQRALKKSAFVVNYHARGISKAPRHSAQRHSAYKALVTLSITMLCHYTECHVLFIVMLNVVMLNVVMLRVVAPFKMPRTFYAF